MFRSLFVFDSCDFVDRPCFPQNRNDQRSHTKNTKLSIDSSSYIWLPTTQLSDTAKNSFVSLTNNSN